MAFDSPRSVFGLALAAIAGAGTALILGAIIVLTLQHLWNDHQIDDQIRAIQRQQIQQLQQQQAPPKVP